MRRMLPVLLLLAASLAPWRGAQADGSTIVFILDASGSMNEQVDRRPKIEIAKEVLGQLTSDLPQDIEAGLIVFGHRQKEDCNDIETIVPSAPGAGSRIAGAIQPLQAVGKTPLTSAIRKAAETLRGKEGEKTIILVSDGKETCGGNPIVAVAELRNSGIDFKTHVIGFDVTAEERAELEGIAQAGKGRYYNAQSAAELKEALGQVKAVVLERRTAPTVAVLPKGGDTAQSAAWLSIGEYVTDRVIPSNRYEYFAVKIKGGQTLAVKFRTPDRGNPYAGAVILNDESKELARETVIGDTNEIKEIGWATNSSKEEVTLIVGVGNEYSQNAKGTTYTLSVQDSFDAGTSTDAPETIENPLTLQPGKVEGFLGGKSGGDRADCYAVAVKANQTLNVKAVPPMNAGFTLTLWDEDRVKREEENSANAGAVVRASWKPATSQNVAVMIKPYQAPDKSFRVPYTLEVSLSE